ncbi:hypothetical protein AA0120_g10790 [Alternaria tenuissima]|nr:hypothetical protein AA0120_g10790 [Alternaria tenuissima]
MDPGTALAVVSLVLQVASGLHEYFKLWKDCDEDVATLGASLTRITKIFEHLASLLRAPVLDSALVSTICGNVKECEEKIKELEQILKRFKKEGTPASTYEKLKLKSRRALYPFRASTILSISELVEDMKDDLSIALQLLSIDTNVSSSVKLDTIENHVLTFGSKIDAVSRDLETIGAQIHSVDSNVLSMDPKLDGLKSQLELEFKGISAIIEHLREHLQPLDQQQGRPNLAYFHFAFDDTFDISTLIRSILCQICVGRDIPTELRELFSEKHPAKPSTPALKAALRSILRSDSGDTSHLQIQSPGPHEIRESYFVFDGLDEIPHGELREEILGLLSDLSTTFGSNKIHILVTSRPDKDISEYLPGSQGWLRLSMGRCKIEDDIALYVSGQISSHAKLSRLPLDVKNRIKHELVQGANGMFRWTALQMQDLRRLRIVRACDVLRILSSLPKDLNATYEKILSRIDPMYRREALTALEWLVFARRPLFLEEVAEASIIDRSSKKIIDPNRQLDPSDIADMLVGLVIVEPEVKETTAFLPNTHMMSLAHFSVREYLTTPNTVAVDSGSWSLEASLAHSNITLDCFAYIRYCYTCNTSKLAKTRPLESYALHFWTEHAAFAPEMLDNPGCDTVLQIFSDYGVCRYWMQRSRVFWTTEEPIWDRTWLKSAMFLDSPYNNPSISSFLRVLSYYPLYHCVVHGLDMIVRYILDKSSPLLSFGDFPSTLETAVLLDNFDIVELLLRKGASFGNSLRLAFRQRNNAVAIELIRQGCDVKASDLVLATPWCSPKTILHLLSARRSLDLDSFALALNASLVGQKEVTKLLLDHLSSRHIHGSKGNSNLQTVYEDLLITASRLGLSRTIDYLINPAESPLPYHGQYDRVLFAATVFQRPEVITSLLNSEAKSKISYVSFATLVRRTTTTKDYATFRSFLRHIPLGTYSPGCMLRIAIACNHEPLAIRLLSDGAGVDDHGSWVDDISLMASILLQQKSVVKSFMLSKSNFSSFCHVLRGKGIVQDICEMLHAYGAKLAIHHFESRTTILPKILALAKADSLAISRAIAKEYRGTSHLTLSTAKVQKPRVISSYRVTIYICKNTKSTYPATDYVFDVEYTLRRLVEAQSGPFRFTESSLWRFGSHNLQNFNPAISADISLVPTGATWNRTVLHGCAIEGASDVLRLLLHRVENLSNTPWLTFVYNVDLRNEDEASWENMPRNPPGSRNRVIVRNTLFDQQRRSLNLTNRSTSTTQYWNQVLRDTPKARKRAGPAADSIPFDLIQLYELIVRYNLNMLTELEWSRLLELFSALPLNYSLRWLHELTSRLLLQDHMSRCTGDM